MRPRHQSPDARLMPWRGRARSAADDPPSLIAGMATFRALRNRNYRLFYIGQSISLCGTWMQTIAQAWLVLQITDSKVALGTVTMLQFLPITIFVLFAGVIADRVPKRNFILGTQPLAMTQALDAGGARLVGAASSSGTSTCSRSCSAWRTPSSSRRGRRSSSRWWGATT